MSDKRRATIADVARAVGAMKATGHPDKIVSDVTHDSRQTAAETLFVAVRGAKFDGNQFISDAMQRGAVGVISEAARPTDFKGAWLQVADARRALAQAAAEVYRHPSRELKLVGVTGTNGKTTTAYLVAAIAEAAGEKTALMGTVEYRIGATSERAERTTMEASDTQKFLRRAVDAGCRVAVMEASSQALDLHRCDGLQFEAAAFTNLTRDHLDYHRTMENYFAAKRKLFDGGTGALPHYAVTNLDDAYGARLAQETRLRGIQTITYALKMSAQVTARDIRASLDGTSFELQTLRGSIPMQTPLVGRPHVYNILTATACALALGFSLETIARAVATCAGAPGRFERVPNEQGFAVVVDYAHTDDALANVLRTARECVAAGGRIITVFGCGGDRDRTKRAPMGEVAARLSDMVFLTSDNPRTEDPEQILADAEVGLKAVGKPFQKMIDRREAIFAAIAAARAGDLVLIAGKGHEDYQIIGAETIHFDDRETAREALRARE
jgi:UDP-N-acetylmuramoyl-L-alanyl-D-glutamate--2,6-diaminopimelate ligase